MQIFESLFDIAYLGLVMALGIRLVLEDSKEAKLFGIMAIVLGIGDSFHLLPRVISHISPGGFDGHIGALSWGKFVTSITMTIFYILYYYFYRKQSGDYDKKKQILIYALAIIRIILVIMPQNNWGSSEESYVWGIYRNIPFAIMGLLLIIWSFKEKEKPGLKNMWWLILFSFAFYIPVVLFANSIPVIGALMMPKTLAYLFIVIFGFKYFIGEFTINSLLGISVTYAIIGIFSGAFAREFSRFYGVYGHNQLNLVHTHNLAMGFLAILALYLVMIKYDNDKIQEIKKPFHIYVSSHVFSFVCMFVIGLSQVIVSFDKDIINMAALQGITGIGHVGLTIGMIWILYKIYKFGKVRN